MRALLKYGIIFMFMSSFLLACSQTGYLKVGIYPRHNEDISNVTRGVLKYRAELSETLQVGLLSMTLNPIFYFSGDWPTQTTRYDTDYTVCECNLIFRYDLTQSTSLYYHKKQYFDVRNRTGAWCNCTYANEIGLQYTW